MSAIRKLGEICDIIAGQHIESQLHNDSGIGTPYLTGPADFREIRPVVSKWTDHPKVYSRLGDVLITVKGAGVGKSNLGLAAAIGRQLMAIRPDPLIVDQSYLFYFLRQQEANIASLAQGATVPGIAKSDVESLEIPHPPLSEQKRIAVILDKADTIRQKRKEAINLVETFLRSTFFELFGDPEVNPKGWQTVPLQDLADLASGVTKGRKFDGKETVTVPYLRVANVQDGFLDLKEIKTIEVLLQDVERYELKQGDVVMTEGGDPDKLGRGAIWLDQVKPCIHQNHIFRVRLDRSKVLPEYFAALAGTTYGKRYFLRAAKQTTGIATINMGQLKAFPVLVPPLSLQAKFATFAYKVWLAKVRLGEAATSHDALFQSLAHRAFRGELASTSVERLVPAKAAKARSPR